MKKLITEEQVEQSIFNPTSRESREISTSGVAVVVRKIVGRKK